MSDLIERQAAIDIFDDYNVSVENGELEAYSRDRKRLCDLPPAQPELCEDAVSRQRLLSDLRELVAAWKKHPVMAEQIKGVETAIEYVELIPSVKPNSKELSETHKALDTVSRQAAIDELKRISFSHLFECGEYLSEDTREIEIINSSKALEAIEALPSAQPEPHWIPVSKRLPEDGEDCLVSIRCPNEFFLVDMATYSTDLFKVDEERFFGKRGESGWYYLSSEYGCCEISNVIAWMPEPRPYKEIKDEGSD